MFDMGFTEMLLIGIVALVVIGPERLPGVARTAGKYFSRLRNFMTNVRADVESELKADELRQMFEKQQEELQSLKEVVSEVGNDIGLSDIASSISDTGRELEASLNPQPDSITKPKPEDEPKPKASPIVKTRAKSKAVPKMKLSPKTKAKAETKTGHKPRSTDKTKAGPRAKSAIKKKGSVSKRTKATVSLGADAGSNQARKD